MARPDVADLLEITESALTVRQLDTVTLFRPDPASPSAPVSLIMEQADFDVAPLDDDPPARYVRRDELAGTATVADAARPITADLLVTADLGLADAVTRLAYQEFFFVLDGDVVRGIVTRADLQRPAVSMVALSFVLIAEAGLDRMIDAAWPGDAWLEQLTERRAAAVREVYAARQRRNTEIGLLECLNLDDRLRLAERSEALRTRLGHPSRTGFKRWSERLKRLRDPLAHGGDLLSAADDAAEAITLFAGVMAFAEAAWAPPDR